MIVYRIAKAKWRKDLSGTGAKLWGGRWNTPGNPMLYTSQSISLALLEMMANTPSEILINNDYYVIEIEIPQIKPSILNLEKLPTDWNKFPYNPMTQKIGDKWLKDDNNLILKVPSAIIHLEANYVLNPNHSKYDKIIIKASYSLEVDNRLIKT